MSQQDLFDYVMRTPYNTNPTILEQKIKEISGGGGSADEEWFNDGDTHIWITLNEGRNSPMVGIGVNGTVTVDWGDGTEPDVLTGTSTSSVKWTPNHEYAAAGDYVIRLTVDGKAKLLPLGTAGTAILAFKKVLEAVNTAYVYMIKRAEIGNSVDIGNHAFSSCRYLSSIAIPNGVTSIGNHAFNGCSALTSIAIPNGVTSIGDSAFVGCHALTSIAIPNGVTSIGSNTFQGCSALTSIAIPNGVTSIGTYAFYGCYALPSITIPSSVTSIDTYAFNTCYSLTFIDFSGHTAVPALSNINAFSTTADCEIRVPKALYNEWIAATNWSTYADKIVAV